MRGLGTLLALMLFVAPGGCSDSTQPQPDGLRHDGLAHDAAGTPVCPKTLADARTDEGCAMNSTCYYDKDGNPNGKEDCGYEAACMHGGGPPRYMITWKFECSSPDCPAALPKLGDACSATTPNVNLVCYYDKQAQLVTTWTPVCTAGVQQVACMGDFKAPTWSNNAICPDAGI